MSFIIFNFIRYSDGQINEDERGRACITYRREQKSYKAGYLEIKRPLRRPRHRREDCINLDLKESGLEDVDSIYQAQGRDQW